jgi:hypothetical protein
MLKAGVADTRDDAVAQAQNWAVEFLGGQVPIMSNFRNEKTNTRN